MLGAGLLLLLSGGVLMALSWPRAPLALPSTPMPAATPLLSESPLDTPLSPPATATPCPTPTNTPEPIVPTRTPAPVGVTPAAAATAVLLQPTAPAAALAPTSLWEGRARWGVGVPLGPITRYDVAPLRLGWYLDWSARADAPTPDDVQYVQMVRLHGGALRPDAAAIAAIAAARPGALWLIGNEPDVRWQDNVDAATYARLYHEAYAAIKGADPSARVAIGGVSQPTPLRLRYLDVVLASYREQFGAAMPVDVWNVHNFILREERDSWGVDIPPGLPDDHGALYTIEDSGNLAVFRQQIVDFRRWMAERGYGGYPLIVSEYGIPMPEDYGYPPERVIDFLTGTFDFFLTAQDPALGDPLDGYRLVQRWCWYSLADVNYPTGNLFDPATAAMTAVGIGWTEYVASR